MALYINTDCDIYSPFGAASPATTGVPCRFYEAIYSGRGFNPQNVVCYTHYVDVANDVDIFDGCTRTASLSTINYADGDEVRIPANTEGAQRYVTCWVSRMRPTEEQGAIKRAYLMRHNNSAGGHT